MLKTFTRVHASRLLLVALFVVATLVSSASLMIKDAEAAGFKMMTGYYFGTAASLNVTGLGFQPDLVIIKAAGTGFAVFKTSAMASNLSMNIGNTTINTTSFLTLTSDGFDLSATSNSSYNASGTLYYWSAFGGSDCTSSGTFCVNTHTGNGTGARLLETGFEPGLAIVRRTATFAAHFRTASMPVGQSEFFSAAANDTTGAYINSFASNGFNVGSSNNLGSQVYYTIAFKKGAGVMNEGTFTGDGVDDRNITGVGFKPDLLMIKNTTSATTISKETAIANSQAPYGITGIAGSGTANIASDAIQKIQTDGFQLGTNGVVNESGATMYWFAMGGVVQPPGSGTFTMSSGSYTGTGVAQSIIGVGFKPDLVMIKDATSNGSLVYRTPYMLNTAYVGQATTDVASITSLDTDGFSVNTNATVNASARTYHWQAFGNAYKPEKKSGAADFAMGIYPPTGIDDTYIPGPPGNFDFIHIKAASTQSGAFRTSEQAGDLTGQLTAAPEIPNGIQSIDSGGFQVGNAGQVNVIGSNYRWFGFKNGSNFATGSYVGDGVNDKPVALGAGFQPDLVWVKQTAGAQPLLRPATVLTDSSLYMINLAPVTGRIKTLTPTGMTVGSDAEVNSSGARYRYIAWSKPVFTGSLTGQIVDPTGTSVASPSATMSATGYPFECSASTGTLGTSAQRVRISNTTTNAPWTVSIAATNGAAALWANAGNTRQYDFNDPTGSPAGCTDGSDADSFAGKLRIEPAGATITPQSGCSAANVTLGSNQNFNQGTVDAITLVSASSGAQTGCYWDITNINMQQYIPANQPGDTYNLNLTITTIAS